MEGNRVQKLLNDLLTFHKEICAKPTAFSLLCIVQEIRHFCESRKGCKNEVITLQSSWVEGERCLAVFFTTSNKYIPSTLHQVTPLGIECCQKGYKECWSGTDLVLPCYAQLREQVNYV